MICILLSTFDGAQFLEEQLGSLLDQSVKDWTLLVRDDGSRDGTCAILQNYAAKDSRIQLLTSGERLGAIRSYFRLLESACEADYYAFCDQDDVWHRDKLLRSRKAIAAFDDQPALYCSRTRLVDQRLNHLGLSRNYSIPPSFHNALIQNIATGCTVLFNSKALELVRSRPVDLSQILMHDWWCYLLVTAFGKVVYDPEPTLDYRQHSTNSIGELKGFQYWSMRLQRFFNRSAHIPLLKQLQEFEKCWGKSLPAAESNYLSRLRSLMSEERLSRRIGKLSSLSIRRQTLLDSVLFRFLLLIGHYR